MTKKKNSSVARDIVESEVGMFGDDTEFTKEQIAAILNRLFGKEDEDETDPEPVQSSES